MAIFLDEAQINIKAGNGGSGVATFFHLKTGGKKVANGGNGGKGGDIVIKANTNINTLYGFKKKIHFKFVMKLFGSPYFIDELISFLKVKLKESGKLLKG